MVVSPRRHGLLALGIATLAVAAPSHVAAQRAPQSATVTMQARVTILPAVEASLASFEGLRDVAALDTSSIDSRAATDFERQDAHGALALPTRMTRTERVARVADDGTAGPPVLRTLEWVDSEGDERLVRYLVAVIS